MKFNSKYTPIINNVEKKIVCKESAKLSSV